LVVEYLIFNVGNAGLMGDKTMHIFLNLAALWVGHTKSLVREAMPSITIDAQHRFICCFCFFYSTLHFIFTSEM
jgi:hypothetical protein